MAIDRIERLRYYQQQFLGALDFEDEQAYHRDMRRRHSVGLHTWGIVVGLELEERQPPQGSNAPIEIFVRPGFAIDGYGRELVVLEPLQLEPDPQLFHGLTGAQYVPVWITYAEERVRRPAAGYEQCDEGVDQMSRIRERFRIVVGERSLRSALVVAGRDVEAAPGGTDVPPDESVPYQEFPVDEEPLPHWLVRLGSVNWDARPGQRRFLPNDPAQLNSERRYVASVAAELLAPAARLRVRDRWTRTDPARETDDFAAVEGSLRVDGLLTARDSIRLEGGMIDFRDGQGGAAPNLELYREEGEGLRIRLGDESQGDRKLTIGIDTGTPSAPAFEAKVTVNDKGEVDTRGRLDVFGHVRLNERLEIRDAAGGTDGDILWIARHRRAANQTDLRLVIGDDASGDDRLVVGPLNAQFEEKFSVANDGTTRIDGSAFVADNVTVGAGSNGTLWARHVDGKNYTNDDPDNLYLNWSTGRDVHVGGSSNAPRRSGLNVTGGVVVGYGGNGVLKTRHVDGKNYLNDNDDDLHLNWNTGRRVWVGSSGVPASLTVTGDLVVAGDVESILKVHTETLVVKNAGRDTPASWRIDYPGVFSRIYTAFAVFQGYSMWENTSVAGFSNPANWSHAHTDGAIVQHLFVRVDDVQTTYASGLVYASESTTTDPNWELDNTVLFTVVVLGRE